MSTVNWAAVTFGKTAIARITTGGFGQGGKLLRFKGDTDLHRTVIASVSNEPHATFTTRDVETVTGIAPGTVETLSATLNDTKDETGQAVVFTMINAVFESADTAGQFGRFGSVIGTWQAFSSDGVTNPLSFATTQSDPVPDALLLNDNRRRGGRMVDRVASISEIADRLLAVNREAGERAYIRLQDAGRLFVTKSPSDTIRFPKTHERGGQPRYRWVLQPDGTEFGYLLR